MSEHVPTSPSIGDRLSGPSERQESVPRTAGKVATFAATDRTGWDQRRLALDDVFAGIGCWRLWTMIGWQEIRSKYRRSLLGPFWLTISMGGFVFGLGVVYSLLFRTTVSQLMPHLALGMIVWTFASQTINESCVAFIRNEPLIKQIRLPLSVHLLATGWTNVLVLAHNAVIYVLVALWFGIWPGLTGLLAIPGAVLVVLNLGWIGLLLSSVCARFRDIPEIIRNIIQLMFFITPIFWEPSMLPERAVLVDANPFFHLIEVIRAPLLGRVPALSSWLFLAAGVVVGWMATIAFFTRFRRRIAYWL